MYDVRQFYKLGVDLQRHDTTRIRDSRGPKHVGYVIFNGQIYIRALYFSGLKYIGCVIFTDPTQTCVRSFSAAQNRLEFVISTERQQVAIKNVASNNTRVGIKHYPILAGRSKEGFPEYMSTVRVCLSLYSKIIFDIVQGKAQSSLT